MSEGFTDEIVSMALQIISKDQCWLCENIAPLTREHQIKATWFKDMPLETNIGYFGEEGKGKLIQSKKSDGLKYGKSICARCNGHLTKSHDSECDKLFKLIKDTSQYSLIKQFAENNINLKRYFAKLLGCRMTDSEIALTKKLREFVYNGDDFPKFFLRFTHSRGIKNLPFVTGVEPLFHSVFEYSDVNSANQSMKSVGVITHFQTSSYFENFEINYGFELNLIEQAAYKAMYGLKFEDEKWRLSRKANS